MKSSLNTYFPNVKKVEKNLNTKKVNLKTETSASSQTSKEYAEEKLIKFDLDPSYGPCKGMTRTQRYESSVKLNLNPPAEIKDLIQKHSLETSFYDRFI